MFFISANSAMLRTLTALLFLLIIAGLAAAAVYFGKRMQKRNEKSIEIDELEEVESFENETSASHKKQRKGTRNKVGRKNKDKKGEGNSLEEEINPNDNSEAILPSDFIPEEEDDDEENEHSEMFAREILGSFPYLNEEDLFDEKSVPELEFADKVEKLYQNHNEKTGSKVGAEISEGEGVVEGDGRLDVGGEDDVVLNEESFNIVQVELLEEENHEEENNGRVEEVEILPKLGRYEGDTPHPMEQAGEPSYLLPPVPKRRRDV